MSPFPSEPDPGNEQNPGQNPANWPPAERPPTQWPNVSFLEVILAFAVAAAIALAALFGVLIFESLHAGREGLSQHAVLGLLVLEPAAILTGLYLVIIRRGRVAWRDLGLKPVSPGWVLISVFAALASLVVSGLITEVIDRFQETSMIDEYIRVLAPHGVSLPQAAILVVVVGGLVPAAEELLFRGLCYGWLRGRWGPRFSAVVSAGLFALAHTNLRMGIQIFLIGIVLAALYERSRTLLAPISGHMTVNTVSLLVIFAQANAG